MKKFCSLTETEAIASYSIHASLKEFEENDLDFCGVATDKQSWFCKTLSCNYSVF